MGAVGGERCGCSTHGQRDSGQCCSAWSPSAAAFETGSELLGSVGDRTSTQVKLLPCYISDAALIQRVGHVRFFFTSPRAEWTGFIHCYS